MFVNILYDWLIFSLLTINVYIFYIDFITNKYIEIIYFILYNNYTPHL